VVGQPVDVLREPIAIEPLHHVQDPGVEGASSVLE
jgi:hypothetical protein